MDVGLGIGMWKLWRILQNQKCILLKRWPHPLFPFENSHVWRIKIEVALSRVYFLDHGGIFIMSGENVAIRILPYRIPGQHASIFLPPQLAWTVCH